MAGGIFHPSLDLLGDVNRVQQNVLHCYLCNGQYDEPCLLHCFHSFCAGCLRGRSNEGKMSCPLCGCVSDVNDVDNLPPPDKLLNFLVHSSAVDEKTQCANCDQEWEKMFFCNTCCQPLCEDCRHATHRARMFSKHDVVELSQRAEDVHKQCLKHGEPYIMFSTANKKLLCITCFRDIDMEGRVHCVDLEKAYSDGKKNLDQTVLDIKDLQTAVQDGSTLVRSLLEEIKESANTEREAILTMFGDLQQKLVSRKDELLQKVERQYRGKERHFREQLTTLNAVLPTLHLHLVACALFHKTTNKFQFLEMVNPLLQRLGAIAQHNLPLQPRQTGQINTNFKVEFARCLDSLLNLRELYTAANKSRADSSGKRIENCSVGTGGTFTFTSDGGRRINGSGSNKVIIIEANGAFAKHLRDFESKHREVLQRYEGLKLDVQELQRDLTLRRCVAKVTCITNILNQCTKVQNDIQLHLEGAEKQRILLEKHWEEVYQGVSNEQEVYQAQVNDILRIKEESQHLAVIGKQLVPFIRSITDVTERISPKLGTSCQVAQQEDKVHALFDQISSIEPDSKQRVDAIHAVEEDRQIQTANRVNPIDEELIKTKGMLKAPSARKERDPLSRKDSGNELDIGKREGVSLRELLCEEIVQRGENSGKKRQTETV